MTLAAVDPGNPLLADGLGLRQGTWITLEPEHIVDFDRPLDEYLVRRFATNFREVGLTSHVQRQTLVIPARRAVQQAVAADGAGPGLWYTTV